MAVEARIVPSRWRLTYAFELIATDGKSAANRVVNLPLNPEVYEERSNAAVETTYTAGGVLVEESGFLEREIMIRGSTGLARKRGWDRNGAMLFGDGHRLHAELVGFFDDYDKIKRDPALNPHVLLAWHDYVRDRHYVVVPETVSIERDAAGARMEWPYEFRLRAVGDYEDVLKRKVAPDGIFAGVRNFAQSATDALDQLTGYVEDARAFVDEGNRTLQTAVVNAIDAVDALFGAATGLRNGVLETISAPRRYALALLEKIEEWGDIAEDLLDITPWRAGVESEANAVLAGLDVQRRVEAQVLALLAHPDLFSETFAARSTTRRNRAGGEASISEDELATATPGSSLASRVTPGTGLRRAVERRRARGLRHGPDYQSVREYTVRLGDTMHSIAAQQLGGPEAWQDILDVNPDLRPPYLSASGLPGTVRVGDVLLLPSFAAASSVTTANGPELGRRADDAILGVDFELDEDGEWSVAPSGTDVVLVRGVANFVQAFQRVKFRTRLGENVIYPGVGIFAPVGDANGPSIPSAVAVSVRSVVAQDGRVDAVMGLEVVDLGDGVSVEVTARIRGVDGQRTLRRPVE